MKIGDQQMMEVRLERDELICRMKGMVAENHERDMQGNSLAYGGEAWAELEGRFKALREKLVLLGEKGQT